VVIEEVKLALELVAEVGVDEDDNVAELVLTVPTFVDVFVVPVLKVSFRKIPKPAMRIITITMRAEIPREIASLAFGNLNHSQNLENFPRDQTG